MSSKKSSLLEKKAKKLEYKYVHKVYSAQALSYDGLCDGPWPEIKNFLFSLPTGSFVADVGKLKPFYDLLSPHRGFIVVNLWLLAYLHLYIFSCTN